jgi:hypothetical protein
MLITYIDEDGLNALVNDDSSWAKAIQRSINSQYTQECEEEFTIRLLIIPKPE